MHDDRTQPSQLPPQKQSRRRLPLIPFAIGLNLLSLATTLILITAFSANTMMHEIELRRALNRGWIIVPESSSSNAPNSDLKPETRQPHESADKAVTDSPTPPIALHAPPPLTPARMEANAETYRRFLALPRTPQLRTLMAISAAAQGLTLFVLILLAFRRAVPRVS